MKTLLSIVSAAILTVAASTASAAPVQLTTAQLDGVSAGALTYASAGSFAVGLFPSTYSDTTTTVSWWGTSSSAYSSSSAFIGAVSSSAVSCSFC
ncbi:exported hypothetical protein [Crenothrix polyspora]|uniref:Uncharacterized protein n=1 Tax=Crenothrix polyspora TaxID=360316 RepID=A0A1R4H2B5_9GAMM|nr:hypothetical protein [Crenothrix polyspora]SJM90381.1 exported hypothetical protein [Crenothrix polyspora]